MSSLARTVQRVSIVVPDAVGRLVGKTIAAAEWDRVVDEGMPLPDFHLITDYANAPMPGLTAAGESTGFRNGLVRPDLTTLRVLPWDERAAIVIADAFGSTGDVESCSPRSILQSQVARLREQGLTASVATELEFYLVAGDNPARQGLATPVFLHERNADHDLLGMSAYEPFVVDVVDTMAALGYRAEAFHGEGGVGQLEVAFPHGDPLTVSDRHVMFKYVVKRLALTRGLSATFMAQPFLGEPGSSCHIHVSLWRDGEPVLLDPSGTTTELGRRVLASLLDLAPQSALVHAPNVNSYRRLQPGSWAPSDTSWGYDNRTALVRVLGSGSSGRFEFRLPGADCNPYLSLATVLASTRVEQNAQGESRDAAAVETFLYDHEVTTAGHAPAATPLPRDLGQALALFSGDKRLPALLGDDVCEHLAARGAAELAASRTVVTDWERLRLWEVC